MSKIQVCYCKRGNCPKPHIGALTPEKVFNSETSKLHMMADLIEDFQHSAVAVDYYNTRLKDMYSRFNDLTTKYQLLSLHADSLQQLTINQNQQIEFLKDQLERS